MIVRGPGRARGFFTNRLAGQGAENGVDSVVFLFGAPASDMCMRFRASTA
jgi:hypothetical protein